VIAVSDTPEEQRLRVAMHSADADRARWARELHDETLQGLGALRMMLVAARRSGDGARVGEVIERLDEEIDNLRGLVRELRPAALDELGLAAATEGLAARIASRHEIEVEADVRLREPRLPQEVETALYRIIQEALSNAVRHASARHARIAVYEDWPEVVCADIRDDGHGFDPDTPAAGFGLAGMRERVALLHGELELTSSAGGTHVAAVLPMR
jgi:signal transduction histidine kinase